MATKRESNPWYPAAGTFGSYHQDDAVKQLYDHIYNLHDQLSDLHSKHQELHTQMQGTQKENTKLKEIVNNRIAGRLVKPTNPADGDTIRYNKVTGQFEFGA